MPLPSSVPCRAPAVLTPRPMGGQQAVGMCGASNGWHNPLLKAPPHALTAALACPPLCRRLPASASSSPSPLALSSPAPSSPALSSLALSSPAASALTRPPWLQPRPRCSSSRRRPMRGSRQRHPAFCQAAAATSSKCSSSSTGSVPTSSTRSWRQRGQPRVACLPAAGGLPAGSSRCSRSSSGLRRPASRTAGRPRQVLQPQRQPMAACRRVRGCSLQRCRQVCCSSSCWAAGYSLGAARHRRQPAGAAGQAWMAAARAGRRPSARSSRQRTSPTLQTSIRCGG